MTFNCTRVKGPPFILNPIRLAGTRKQYSKKAIPHERSIIPISGHPVVIFISSSFRWPYHAKVIKMFDVRRNRTVVNDFIDSFIVEWVYSVNNWFEYLSCYSISFGGQMGSLLQAFPSLLSFEFDRCHTRMGTVFLIDYTL